MSKNELLSSTSSNESVKGRSEASTAWGRKTDGLPFITLSSEFYFQHISQITTFIICTAYPLFLDILLIYGKTFKKWKTPKRAEEDH